MGRGSIMFALPKVGSPVQRKPLATTKSKKGVGPQWDRYFQNSEREQGEFCKSQFSDEWDRLDGSIRTISMITPGVEPAPQLMCQDRDRDLFFTMLRGFLETRAKLDAVASLTSLKFRAESFTTDQALQRCDEDDGAPLSFDAVYARSEAALQGFECFLTTVARSFLVGLKPRPRALEKLVKEYNSNGRRLVDVVRGAITVDTERELQEVTRAIFDSGRVVRFKNRFLTPTHSGYRDALFNVLIQGHVCEVTVHLAAFKKQDAHRCYATLRSWFQHRSVEECTVTMEAVDSYGSARLEELVSTVVRSRDDRMMATLEALLGSREIAGARHFDASIALCSARIVVSTDEANALRLQSRLAEHLFDKGDLEAASELASSTAQAMRDYFGETDQETVSAVHFDAKLVASTGNFSEATERLRFVAEQRAASLGTRHAATLGACFDLALASMLDGGDAADFLYHVHARCEAALSAQHPLTLAAAHTLACLYHHAGRPEEARPIFQAALTASDLAFGSTMLLLDQAPEAPAQPDEEELLLSKKMHSLLTAHHTACFNDDNDPQLTIDLKESLNKPHVPSRPTTARRSKKQRPVWQDVSPRTT